MQTSKMGGNEVLKLIRERGFWRTLIKPRKFQKERIPSLSACKKLIAENQVALRGWYFPHIEESKVVYRRDFVEFELDWLDEKEYWRFYQSGQFIHFFAFSEDWENWETTPLRARGVPPGRILSVFSTLFSITERYEFAARLAQKANFQEGVSIEIGLHGTNGRQLVSLDPSRDLLSVYTSHEPEIVKSIEVGFEELLGSARELALDHAIYVFERFNWSEPPRTVLADDQLRLLERRL